MSFRRLSVFVAMVLGGFGLSAGSADAKPPGSVEEGVLRVRAAEAVVLAQQQNVVALTSVVGSIPESARQRPAHVLADAQRDLAKAQRDLEHAQRELQRFSGVKPAQPGLGQPGGPGAIGPAGAGKGKPAGVGGGKPGGAGKAASPFGGKK
ncbi:MAG: hypothetical protein WED34_14155 [Planctomycetales bacterium]